MAVILRVLRFIVGAAIVVDEVDEFLEPDNLRRSRNVNLVLAALALTGAVMVAVLWLLLRNWGLV